MAYTQTATKAHTRITFLKIQLRWALRQTTDISETYLDTLMAGVEKQWINNFSIYAINANNLCRGELVLEIDWSEHNNQLYIGKATVSIDQKWKDDILIEVDETVYAFKDYVKSLGLRTNYRIGLTNAVWNNASTKQQAFSQLSLSVGEPVKWAGEKKPIRLSNRDFPELGVILNLAE